MRSWITETTDLSQTTPEQPQLSWTLSYAEAEPEIVEIVTGLGTSVGVGALPPLPVTQEAFAATDPYTPELFDQLGQLLSLEWSQLDELTLASLKANWDESRDWLTARPDQLLPTLLRSYENAVHQNRAIRDMQRELQTLRKRLKLQPEPQVARSLEENLESAEASLTEHRQWLADHPDAMLLLDSKQAVRYANPAATQLLGLDLTALLNQPLGLPLSCHPTELPFHKPGGEARVLELQSVETIWQGDKGHMVVLRDITQHKNATKQWQQVALHDPLTGLPNRSLLLDRLGQALQRLKREPARSFAVLFVDLDGFKDVNDDHGHACGDAMLQALSHRISRCIREGDTLARLGGDEFVLLLDNLNAPEEAIAITNRILETISQPVALPAAQIQLSASVGIAMNHPRYQSAEQILEDADLAMYQAKARGKARYELFQAPKQLTAK